ncbi:MAG TPA: DUF5335 family protein [Solirubrobacteraceae bacterium]
MADETRELQRAEWKTYFDDFSRDLGDFQATVEVDGRDIGAQTEAEGVRLAGITYDDGDDIVVIGLDAPGGIQEEVERIISEPQTIYVATEDGGATTFDIEDAEGHKTLVRLEPVV